jgi:hypothetical protein
MIPASEVSFPVLVTSIRSEPAPFTVPAMRSSPSPFSIGRDSPVIIASSTELWPPRTTPSAGMRAPGRMSKRSPARTSEIGTSSVRPSTSRTAVEGKSLASSLSAPCAWEIERISIQ